MVAAKATDGTDGFIHDTCYDAFTGKSPVEDIPAFMDRRE